MRGRLCGSPVQEKGEVGQDTRGAAGEAKVAQEDGRKMMVELGVGILAVGAAGYAVYWQTRRARWAKMPRWARTREERAKRLKRLGDHIDSLWGEMYREEKRSKRLRRKGEVK
ncbi:hypothetical protein ES706_00193 [subsurface metagenome]